MVRRTVCAAAVAFALTLPAVGQSFNIDFETPFLGGPGFGTPANTYGAASGQVGFWQSISSVVANTPTNLLGLNGALTAVTMTSINTLQGFGSTNNSPVGGDDSLLLSDALNLGFPGAQNSFAFNNLANGSYDVFVYAMAPDFATFLTRVNVNGPAFNGAPGAQVCGGAYPGAFVAPITHVEFHGIVINTGQMIINLENASGFGSLAAVQIVQVPGPGGLSLIGIGSLCGRRRRRTR